MRNDIFTRKLFGNSLFVLVDDENEDAIYYFTSLVNIAKFVGTSYNAIDYAIANNKKIDHKWMLSIINDGGEIPYKMINNTINDDYRKINN